MKTGVSILLAVGLVSIVSVDTSAVASAQARQSVGGRSAELVCLDVLDVEATVPIARAVVRREAEVIADRASNCFVVVDGGDLTTARETFRRLEERARARRAP
ncbi:MAG: hypothetical protein H6724_14055 [Sandaracinus sp.]|nr:hypothetical protein [Sandaracinus sp.]MCB9620558.1 hypothetical protein [Sandaracinus sp.]